MSLNTEITRIENAKTTLKTKLNSRNDNQHQITNELIDEYGDFVDSIPQGGGIDWNEIGYSTEPDVFSDAFDYAKNIYDNWDSTETTCRGKYSNDLDLVFMPLVDTSNSESFRNTFNNCQRLIYVPQLDTSSCTNFQYMFYNCIGITTIPQLDTSNSTTFQYMFYHCTSITTIPQLDASKCTIFFSAFNSCEKLTNFGGLLNAGEAYLTSVSANSSNYALDFNGINKLTHDSLMNVINGLYDIATKGCNTQKLTLGSTNLAKLTAEEIAIATNKGWTVS